MTIHDGELSRVDPGLDDLAEIRADDLGLVDARLEKQSLANRVDRDLQDPRESVPFPGIEWEIVVADLEVG